MDEEEIRLLSRGPWAGNIRPLRKKYSHERTVALGYAVEIHNGHPYALAVSSPQEKHTRAFLVSKSEALPALLKEAKRLLRGSKKVIITAHDGSWALGSMVYSWAMANGYTWDSLHPVEEVNPVSVEIAGGTFRLFPGAPSWGHFDVGAKRKRRILVLDSLRYYPRPLEQVAVDLELGEALIPPLEGSDTGQRRYQIWEIGPQAIRRAHLARRIGETIIEAWKDSGTRACLSLASHAGNVFRQRHLGKRWVKVPFEIEDLALRAYHGGRNLFTEPPGWFRPIRMYDVNGAYSAAMLKLPAMDSGEWVFSTDYDRGKHEHGFVTIWGKVPETERPILLTHGGRYLWPDERIEALTVTLCEYRALVERCPWWSPDRMALHVWVPDSDEENPLAAMARESWGARNSLANNAAWNKMLPNAIYGKFSARYPSETELGMMRVGSMWYPVVASWITAQARVRMLGLEEKHGAIHTSTDSIMVRGSRPVEVGTNLGDLKLEVAGTALVLRNRLYLIWNRKNVFSRWALHGFLGSPADLLKLVENARARYRVLKVSQWLEARAIGVSPGVAVQRSMTVQVPGLARKVRKKYKGLGNPWGLKVDNVE